MSTVPILTKSSIVLNRVLITLLMMTAARYGEGISNKTKFLFIVLTKQVKFAFRYFCFVVLATT